MMDRRSWAFALLTLGACEAPNAADLADVERTQAAGEIGESSAALTTPLDIPSVEEPEWAEVLADDGHGTYGLSRVVQKSVRAITADDIARVARGRQELREKQGIKETAAAPLAAGITATQHALDRAGKLEPAQRVLVAVELTDEPFGFHAMRNAADQRRAELVETRKKQLAPKQDRVVDQIEQLGGEVRSRLWITNVIVAEIDAGDVAAVNRIPGVIAVTLDDVAPKDEWDGEQLRPNMQLDRSTSVDSTADFYRGCVGIGVPSVSPDSCHDGDTGNRTNTSQPVRIAMIEAERLNRNHVGWKDTATGASRIRAVFDCNSTGCTTTSSNGSHGHGTWTSSLAAGSIEEAQDPAYPYTLGLRTIEQIRRSGIAKEAEIIYFAAGSAADASQLAANVTNRVQAIQRAVTEGADIINMSWGLHTCDGKDPYGNAITLDTATWDVSGLNTALRNALAAGALPVKSAGNGSNSGAACTLTYPAWRPDVLSVAGLNTTGTTEIHSVGIWSGSSRGGAYQRYPGSTTKRYFPGIDLVGPAVFTRAFSESANSGASAYVVPGSGSGTSGAAAVMSGAAALLRDAFYHLGWTQTAGDARQLLTNMIMLGDSWDPEYPYGNRRTSGVGNLSGAGRYMAHYPHPNNLVNTFTWGSAMMHINNNQVVEWDVWFPWAEPSTVRQWKWAVTWFDSDLNNASDIAIEVLDTCNDNVVYNSDYSDSFRKKIELPRPFVANKCLRMRAIGQNIKAGGIDFFTADYFHSGSSTASGNEH